MATALDPTLPIFVEFHDWFLNEYFFQLRDSGALAVLREAVARQGGRLITSTLLREPKALALSTYKMWPPFVSKNDVRPLASWANAWGNRGNFLVSALSCKWPNGREALSRTNLANRTALAVARLHDNFTFDLVCRTDQLEQFAGQLAMHAMDMVSRPQIYTVQPSTNMQGIPIQHRAHVIKRVEEELAGAATNAKLQKILDASVAADSVLFSGAWEAVRSSCALRVGQMEEKEIAPLAKKITEDILDHHLDDAAQEDRWRTTMKRDMVESFRVQREKSDKQREEVQTVKAEVQKVEAELQKQRDAIHEVHSKLDETIQLVHSFLRKERIA